MTEPENPPQSQEPEPAAPPPGSTPLEDYIRSNRATVTEEALRRQALAAGHPPEAIQAALASTRPLVDPVDRNRATRKVFLWYVAVWLILDVLMLINPANTSGGFLGDSRGIGIFVLSFAIAFGFIASAIWIARPRLFWGLIGIGTAIAGLASLTGNSFYNIVAGIAIIGVGAGLTFVAARVGRSPTPTPPSTQLMMVVPFLILLAIGGTCVASGLPIPRPA